MENDLLLLCGLQRPPDAHAIAAALHFEFGDPALVGQVDKLLDFF